ncbi:MAG: glycosyltransferase family 2 protein [Myxococcales bacterium]|nr:glycosyltransferase family 2 protein [Myxococcales bacterium]MDH5566099.1 glycosyltransferase family 2 protein [Myxococcales bacterium]
MACQAAPYLSVVVPIHDESESIEPLYAEIFACLGDLAGGIELLLIDDGSRDDSLELMRKIAAVDRRVRVLALDHRCGQSVALEAGFRAARGEITATLDGDLQNDPADIAGLLTHLDHADVVNGIRANRRDSWVRKLSSRIGNGFRNWMTRDRVTDIGCSLRVMRTEYLRDVKLFRGMHRFLPTLLRMQGARVTEVPVHHRSRRYGRSKYGIGNRLLTGIVDTLAVCWMQRRFVRYRVDEIESGE